MTDTVVRDRSKMGGWLRLFLAVVAVQLIFWKVVDPAVSTRPRLSGALEISRLEVATLTSPDSAALAGAKFEPAEIPWSDCCSRGYRVARHHIEITRIPENGFVLGSPADADNFTIYINGKLAFSRGRMDRDNPTYDAAARSFFSFPAALFKLGDNTIDVVMVRAKMPWFDSGILTIGERDKLIAGFEARSWVLNELTIFNMGVGAVLALLSGVIALRSENRWTALWTGILALAWVLRTGYYRWTDPPFTPEGRLDYYFALTLLAPVSWFGLVTAWSGKLARRGSLVLLALFLAMLGIVSWQIHAGGGEGFDKAGDLTDYFGLGMFAVTIISFLWQFRRGADLRIAESAILALCMTVLACEFYWELRWDTVFGRLDTSLVFLLLAFVAAFLARNIRLFQSTQQINELLQSQLAVRTADLEQAHLREKELVRAKAHQSERQRIMRDMHDGLGSQLMSMLLAARRGEAKPPVVAEGLQTVIDEMRLLIDSMDSVGESLGSAFAIFRERVQPRVEAAGMQFAWHDNASERLPDFGPRDVLQVFRIMQEAVTNALKHSGGTELNVTVAPSPEDGHSVRISICDNGGGLGQSNPRGKGMESMKARAAGIGAKLQVQSSGEGVGVILDLPG